MGARREDGWNVSAQSGLITASSKYIASSNVRLWLAHGWPELGQRLRRAVVFQVPNSGTIANWLTLVVFRRLAATPFGKGVFLECQ